MKDDYTKSPRLYVTDNLSEGMALPLSKDHAHYLMTVLRRQDGDTVRVFNGRDGEFTGEITPVSKKEAVLQNLEKIKEQPNSTRQIHLYFAPIKKDRLSFMIEKAVELGATDLHPVLTARTENRKPNIEKIQSHIVEAAEQCERMDMPTLHPVTNMTHCKFHTPTYAGIEREDYGMFDTSQTSLGVFIGPEGGWTDDEKQFLLTEDSIHPVSLGKNVLRAETAALFMLSRIAG